MADQKISQLTDGTSFQAGDEAVVNRSGTNYKVDPTQFGDSIDVTGTVTADGLTVESSDNATGAVTTLSNTNTSTDSNTVIGVLIFENNDVSAGAANAEIKGLSSGTNGQTDLYIRTGSSGTLYNRAKFDFTGDISFYEDTGTTPKFFWDASAEALGIGTTSPSNPLNVIATNTNVLIEGSGVSSTGVAFETNNITRASIGVASASAALSFFSDAGSTETMRIDASGNLLVGTTTSPSDTGTVVADGVYLGGTGAANLLDDYEEGTWTPEVGRTSTFGTYTPEALDSGKYTKVGDVVFFEIRVSGTNSGASGGSWAVTLPFTVAGNDTSDRGPNLILRSTDGIDAETPVDNTNFQRVGTYTNDGQVYYLRGWYKV